MTDKIMKEKITTTTVYYYYYDDRQTTNNYDNDNILITFYFWLHLTMHENTIYICRQNTMRKRYVVTYNLMLYEK